MIRLTVMIIVGFKYHLYITSFNSYRDGDRRCQHFECNYFISYRTDNIDADIELSGKSNGWVAIGFSSDKKMVSYFNREITTFVGGGHRIFQHEKSCFRRDFKPEKKTTFEADNY